MNSQQLEAADETRATIPSWIAITAAILLGAYHAQNCFGDPVISGTSRNDFIVVQWEYSLNPGGGGHGNFTVCMDFTDHPFLDDDERLFLDGLIPVGATVTDVLDAVNETPVDFSVRTCYGAPDGVPAGCEDNQATEGLLATHFVWCAAISMELSPESTYGQVNSPLVHGIVCGTPGDGTCLSASPCLAPAMGCVDDFVTVIPIVAPCIQNGDFDHDGDVDLLDFGEFQRIFTGPK